MSETERVIEEWRRRAEVLVNDTNPHFMTLLNAYPHLAIAARGYQAGMRHVLIGAKEAELGTINELHRRAKDRAELMLKRYETATAQIAVIDDLDTINKQIFWTNLAIALGKAAEIGLSAASLAKSMKRGLDEAKRVKELREIDDLRRRVDTAKGAAPFLSDGVAAIAGTDTQHPAAAAAAIAGAIAMAARYSARFEVVGKHIWDAAAGVRRATTARDVKAQLALLMQGLKMAVDLARTYFNEISTIRDAYHPAEMAALRNVANVLVIARDLLDLAQTVETMFKNVEAIQRGYIAMDCQIAEREGYLGTERILFDGFRRINHRASTEDRIQVVMDQATDLTTAGRLRDDAAREAARLRAEAQAIHTFYHRHFVHMEKATRELDPSLERVKDCLKRLSRTITDLRFAARSYPSRAAMAERIASQLDGYRASVNAVYVQVQSVLVH